MPFFAKEISRDCSSKIRFSKYRSCLAFKSFLGVSLTFLTIWMYLTNIKPKTNMNTDVYNDALPAAIPSACENEGPILREHSKYSCINLTGASTPSICIADC